jgi:hypothetical protein
VDNRENSGGGAETGQGFNAVTMFHSVFTRTVAVAVSLLLSGAILQPAPAQDDARPGASLLTILPGEMVYSAFGHTALRIRIPEYAVDHVYNFGTFDPEQPSFYVNFALGRLNYRLSRSPFSPTVAFYIQEGRPIIEQHLNLSVEQVSALAELLRENYRPENRHYRYDFFFDNCSTRPRDLLERLPSPSVRIGSDSTSGYTFRQLIDPYMKGHRLVDMGMDLALGAGADRYASRREATFLPLVLMQEVEQATVDTDSGFVPLVAATDTLFWFEPAAARPASPPWVQILLWLMLLMAVGIPVARRIRTRQWRVSRGFDVALFLVVGLAGVVVVVLWFFSEHVVTPRNWNLMWAWPTHLVVAIAIAVGVHGLWSRAYLILTSASVLVALLAWPILPQTFHPAVLPVLLLIAARSLFRLLSQTAPGARA